MDTPLGDWTSEPSRHWKWFITPELDCLLYKKDNNVFLTLLGRIRKILKSHICASTMLYKTLNIVILLVDSLKLSVMISYMFSLIVIKQ